SSPDDFALGDVYLPLLVSDRAAEGPVVLGCRRFGVAGVPVFYCIGQGGQIGVIRPRFEEQHGGLGIFSQPARQDRACRAPTNDNNVILHRAPHNGSSSCGMTSLGSDVPEYSTVWPCVAGWVWLEHGLKREKLSWSASKGDFAVKGSFRTTYPYSDICI